MRIGTGSRVSMQIEIVVTRRVEDRRRIGHCLVFDLQGIVFLQRISDGNRQITRIPLFAVGRPVAHFDGLFPLFVLERPRDPYLVPETVGAARAGGSPHRSASTGTISHPG